VLCRSVRKSWDPSTAQVRHKNKAQSTKHKVLNLSVQKNLVPTPRKSVPYAQPETLQMDYERYQPESWRGDDGGFVSTDDHSINLRSVPNVFERSLVLSLLGRINYQIITGHRVYIEAAGRVYKAIWGGYWRSVFTGVEHFTLKCEEVSGAVWSNDDSQKSVDLPIEFSNNAWTTHGNSLSFLLSRDANSSSTKRTWHDLINYQLARFRERKRAMWC
jgi:hypothetical protein